MVAKRALVVDDSRSARAFLAKLLEEQQIEVDAAETAEQAIDYLLQNRPDVIFMDHLMPGMDGFQAVQAIKANPRTAGIPILMYTSQEGELYYGQARALGAAGVVQKSMTPADVRALLQELQLVPGSPAVVNATADDAAAPPLPSLPPAPAAVPAKGPVEDDLGMRTTQVPVLDDPAIALHLKEEVAALRSELTAALQAHSEQITREVRSLVRTAMPAPTASLPMFPEKPRQSPWAWLLALAASVAAAVLGTLWWQEQKLAEMARTELMDSKSTVALLTARLAPPAPVDGVVLSVPFGEAPLDGARVNALRDFATRIGSLGRQGRIEVRHFAGRFCLSGSAEAGYVLADPVLPAGKCDLVAHSTDAALGIPAAESESFSAAMTELRGQNAALTIDGAEAKGEVPGRSYPETKGGERSSTAGEWNAVAADNNRVEIRWHPAP
jgi:CheY-like chemotaxis protein